MKKSFATLSAMCLAVLTGFTGVVPAQAQAFGDRDRVVGIYCERYNDRDCRDRARWGDDDYRRFYNHRRDRRDNLDAIAAGAIGLTFGAILGSALSQPQPRVNDRVIYLDDEPYYRDRYPRYSDSWEAHVAACYARYRSYDERTDTFMGYDGYRHRCMM